MGEIVVEECLSSSIDATAPIVGAGQPRASMDAQTYQTGTQAGATAVVVGATTLNEYAKYIEKKDAALESRFQTVKVEAPTVEERFRF